MAKQQQESVGSRIRERLDELGLKQSDLAIKTGLTASQIGNYIQGIRNPRHRALLKIVKVLGVTSDWLLFGGVDMRENDSRLIELGSKVVTKETFKDRLESAMKACDAGSTAAALARKLKVGDSTAHKWWSGKTKNIRSSDLFMIADALKVSPRWLWTGQGEMDAGDSIPPELARPELLPIFKILDKLKEPWLSDWISDGERLVYRLNR